MKSTRAIRFFTILSIAIVAISAIATFGLSRITASINRVDAFDGLGNRPGKSSSAVNYLLVGSDTREGLTKAQLKELRVGSVKTAAGKRSDTMLLVHISKKRDKAVLISIPRDTFARIPSYTDSSGKIRASVYSKINSSFKPLPSINPLLNICSCIYNQSGFDSFSIFIYIYFNNKYIEHLDI